ncbi:MAG: hypothetical protein K1000chlam2_00647 [Chlamydiae bacterium]|nr:hypothetical protein [Chlamydiota bacterium]
MHLIEKLHRFPFCKYTFSYEMTQINNAFKPIIKTYPNGIIWPRLTSNNFCSFKFLRSFKARVDDKQVLQYLEYV